MAKNKNGMTAREFYEAVLMGKTKDDIVNGMTLGEKAQALIDTLNNHNKKSSGSDKPSKAYEENAPIREAIIAFFKKRKEAGDDTSVKVKEIAEAIGYTPQKVKGVVGQMINVDGSLEKLDFGRYKPFEYRLKD